MLSAWGVGKNSQSTYCHSKVSYSWKTTLSSKHPRKISSWRKERNNCHSWIRWAQQVRTLPASMLPTGEICEIGRTTSCRKDPTHKDSASLHALLATWLVWGHNWRNTFRWFWRKFDDSVSENKSPLKKVPSKKRKEGSKESKEEWKKNVKYKCFRVPFYSLSQRDIKTHLYISSASRSKLQMNLMQKAPWSEPFSLHMRTWFWTQKDAEKW